MLISVLAGTLVLGCSGGLGPSGGCSRDPAKNQRVAVWLAPLFLEHGKTVIGRRVGTDTHMVEANRDPEEVLREALRVLLRYVRETPELGH